MIVNLSNFTVQYTAILIHMTKRESKLYIQSYIPSVTQSFSVQMSSNAENALIVLHPAVLLCKHCSTGPNKAVLIFGSDYIGYVYFAIDCVPGGLGLSKCVWILYLLGRLDRSDLVASWSGTIIDWWRDQVLLGIIYIEYSEVKSFNTLRQRQNGRHFADDNLKRIFLNENIEISIEISLKFVPNGPINNIPALVQIMAWRRPGDKPSSEPIVVRLPMHVCVTRPKWVNAYTLITRFTGPTWGLSGAERTQVGPMLAPWTLLSG